MTGIFACIMLLNLSGLYSRSSILVFFVRWSYVSMISVPRTLSRPTLSLLSLPTPFFRPRICLSRGGISTPKERSASKKIVKKCTKRGSKSQNQILKMNP